MYKDLSVKNFLACTKVQVARISAIDAILIKKPAQLVPVRRYTFDAQNEEIFQNGVLVTHSEPEGIVAPTTSSGDTLPAIPVASKAVSPIANSRKVSGLKGLKIKPILKKPMNIPIGARGRRKSTHGRIESTCADNPFWNQDVRPNSIETTASVDAINPIETSEPVNSVETTATVDAINPIETTEPVNSIETTTPGDTIDPMETSEPVEITSPTEPASLIEAFASKMIPSGLNDEE